jgi:AcrR family transcriptional regulator
MAKDLIPTAAMTSSQPMALSRRTRGEAQAEKRGAILAAAKAVFERRGYDGASMNEIAAEAAVSKPTLYVYFDSKENLFDALIEAVLVTVPESLLVLDPADPEVEAALTRCGIALMTKITAPEKIDMLRVVLGAAGQFPEIGQKFFRMGPGRAIATFSSYLATLNSRGVLSVPDPDLAAYQLLELIQSVHLRRLMFGETRSVTAPEIERTVRAGVRTFVTAYRGGAP